MNEELKIKLPAKPEPKLHTPSVVVIVSGGVVTHVATNVPGQCVRVVDCDALEADGMRAEETAAEVAGALAGHLIVY